MKVNTNINDLSKNQKSNSSKTPFEQVIEASPLANINVAKDGTILFANKAAILLFGYSAKELKSKNINELFDASLVDTGLQQKTSPQGFHALQKNGSRFYAEVYLNNYEEDGLTKTNLVVIDASEKAEMQASKLNLSLFLENSEEFLLLVDRNYRVLLFNNIMVKGAKERVGVDLKKGIDALTLAPQHMREDVKLHYEKVFKGETVAFDICIKKEGQPDTHFHNVFKPARNKDGVVIAAIISSKNTTQQVEAQARILENERRWSFALESSGQGVWDWNIVTGETFFSPGWKKMLGFSEAEITTDISEWESRLHPDDKEKMQGHIERHLGTDNPYYESEYRLKAKDGSYKWILARGMIIKRDEEGKPLHMIGTHTDITERKRIEGNYKLLFYNNPLPMWTYDRNTLKFINVNNAAIEHYGYSKEEFLKMTILDLRPQEDRELVKADVKERDTGKIIGKSPWRHLKKNGELIFVNISGYTFGEGNKKQTLILSENITEKVKAENELRNSEKQYRTLFLNNPLPSYIYDTKTFKFIKVNKAAIKHYGFSEAEFLQLNLFDIHPPEIHKELKQNSKKTKDLDKLEIHNWKQAKKSGEQIIVDASSTKIEYDGNAARLVVIHDVTEKVKAEQEVKEVNERFQFVTEATADIIWDWDLKKERVLWSDNYEKKFGWKLQDDKTTGLEELMEKAHPDDAEGLWNSAHKAIEDKNKKKWEWEFRFRKADGAYAYVKDTGFILRDENGTAQRLIGALQDITEQKAKEKELLESNERFHLAMQATFDVIYDWHLVKGTLHWSDGLTITFGWKDHEVDIDKWEKLIHGEDRKRVMSSLNKFIADPSTNNWQEQYRFKRKDGSYSYVLDRCFVVRNENGEGVRLIGAMQDISEIKQKEQKLLESNQRFELAAKATSEILWEADFKNKTTYLSPIFKEVFGFEVNEQEFYRTWPQFIHPAEREAALNNLEQILNDPSKNQYQEEYRHVKADGTYIHVVNHMLILRNEDGEVVKMIGAIQDISVRKNAEEEILKTNERFQFASNATSDIIWDWDVATGNVLWSGNYQKIMGWDLPADKVLAIDCCESKFHPEEREQIIAKLKATIADPDKSIWEDEFRYQKNDGSFAFVIDRGFIIRNDKGVAQRIIGAMQDISMRRFEEELQSLELRVYEVSAVPGIHFHNVLRTLINGYENLSSGTHAAISLLGTNDDIEVLAPRLSKEHSRQLRYFIEKQRSGLASIQQPAQKNLIVSSVESEDWRYGEAANVHNWKTSWTVPVYHHNGNLLAFITVFLDQSRTPSELESNTLVRLKNLLRILIVNYASFEQIRIFTERYNNVLKATHDMVWDWNLETGIFYRNAEGVKKVYGIDDVESIENVYSWMERIHPADHIKVQNVINNILNANEENTFDVEYRFKRDDNSYSFIYDRGIIVRNKDGKPVRMIGAAQDVTDRKRLEQELLQKELDRQKSISQATIDTQEEERREIGKELHDNVNQVLTTTKLYLDLSISSPELKDELIKKSSKNIIYVINEIRQLSRSLMDPSIGDLGLIDSINDLVDNINITRKLHVSLTANSELEKYLAENQKLTVFRIIQEAMNNTIKYAQATAVHISIKQNGKEAELQIVDDGKGFNPNTVKKGAGLKNIQNRVYLTNGKLLIDSAPGKGCRIVINFPINNQIKSN